MRVALFALLIGCSSPKEEAPVQEPLDTFVPKKLEEARVPGLSAAIVKKGKIVFTGAWGYADLENKTKVKVDTIFLVASISKTFIATAMMQLIEEGKVAYDDDVNKYLTFSVRNPNFPDKPITIRHLLSHTSSIRESYIRLFSLIGPGDSPEPLEDFLKRFVTPEGSDWAKGANFAAEYGPGGGNSYSQVGAALAALVIEKVTGESFAARVKAKITTPLGMNDSSFRVADLPVERIAFPYVFNGTTDVKQSHWGCGFYPAATMRTTATDLAKHLMAYGNKGAYDGGRLYSDATYTEAVRVAYPNLSADQAELWQWRDIAGRRVLGHSGGAPGASSTMYFDPKDGVGVITLSNSDVHIRVAVAREEQLAAFRSIEERLWTDAAKY